MLISKMGFLLVVFLYFLLSFIYFIIKLGKSKDGKMKANLLEIMLYSGVFAILFAVVEASKSFSFSPYLYVHYYYFDFSHISFFFL